MTTSIWQKFYDAFYEKKRSTKKPMILKLLLKHSLNGDAMTFGIVNIKLNKFPVLYNQALINKK